jgi:hypothetical protein
MTRKRVVLITIVTEIIGFGLAYILTYLLGDYSVVYCLVFSLILSAFTGVSTYFYLIRAFNLDIKQ